MKKSELKTIIREVLSELKYSKDENYWITVATPELKNVNSYDTLKKVVDTFVNEKNIDKFSKTVNQRDYNTELRAIGKKLQSTYIIKNISTNPANNTHNKKFNVIIDIQDMGSTHFTGMKKFGALD